MPKVRAWRILVVDGYDKAKPGSKPTGKYKSRAKQRRDRLRRIRWQVQNEVRFIRDTSWRDREKAEVISMVSSDLVPCVRGEVLFQSKGGDPYRRRFMEEEDGQP